MIEEKYEDLNKQIIADYLNKRAETDEFLKPKLEEKDMDKLWDYIEAKAKEEAGSNRCVCISDAQVFEWAVHFCLEDEEAINEEVNKLNKFKYKPSKPAPVKNKEDEEESGDDDEEVNEEKERKAVQKATKPISKKPAKKEQKGEQLSLFDFNEV